MEIKTGEYIRTKSGIIAKITKIDTNNHYYFDKVVLDNFAELSEKGMQVLLKKHSFDIRKLIEEGDYVNGQKVVGVSSSWIDTKEDIIRKDHIKSIVTHEQFKAMEYEVK